MQFLSNFRQTSWIGMLKTHNKAQNGCPLGFFGKITAVYQINTENDKISNFFVFHSFYAILVKFLTNFVDWNVEKVSKEKNFSPVGPFEEFIAVF